MFQLTSDETDNLRSQTADLKFIRSADFDLLPSPSKASRDVAERPQESAPSKSTSRSFSTRLVNQMVTSNADFGAKAQCA